MSTFAQLYAEVARKLDTLEAKKPKVDVTVTGSGDINEDDNNIAKALKYLEGSKRTLWLSGDLFTKQRHRMQSGIQVRGKDNARLTAVNTGGLAWIKSGFPTRPSSSHIPAVAHEGFDFFEAEGLNVQRGDWVLVYGDNNLTVRPHNGPSGYQSPAEIHRVERVEDNRIYIAGIMFDTISVNGKACKLPTPIQNPLVENLTLDFIGDSQNNYATSLYLYGCASPRLINVRSMIDGPGAWQFVYCMDGSIDSPVIEGVKKADGVYGVVLSLCNGITVNNPHFSGTRHPITSSSGFTYGRRRYGTPCNVTVNGGIWNVMTKINGRSRVGVDTHAEGKNWLYDGLTINVGSNSSLGNYGGNSRSRNTIWNKCIFRGTHRNGTGLTVYSPNVIVQGCTFENLLWPLRLRSFNANDPQAWYSNLKVNNNIFRNCLGPAVWIKEGDKHTVSNNIIENCGRIAGGNPQYESCLILIEKGSGHRVIGNDLPKHTNKFSIAQYELTPAELYAAGNYMTGYNGTCGFMNSASYAAMENAYRSQNFR